MNNKCVLNYYTLIILLLFNCGVSVARILINEVQYKNDNVLQSQDGAYYDWIELYNHSADSIDITHYYIKDGLNDKDVLLFSDCIMAPHSYLLVFCSQQQSTNTEWHAPFKLSALKDSVLLFSNQHQLIDCIEPTAVPPNLSLARYPDGGALQVRTATPKQSNNSSKAIDVHYVWDTLYCNLNNGFYNEEIDVLLSHQHSENEIRYTLNGKSVSADDMLYDGTLHLSDINNKENRFANYDPAIANPGKAIPKGHILRAQVFSEGCPASHEICRTFFIGDTTFTHQLPIVSIIVEPKDLFGKTKGIYQYPNYYQRGKQSERKAHIEFFDKNRHLILEQNAGLRIHGAGSRTSPQKSFKLIAHEDYGDASFSYPFFSQKPELTEFPELLLKCVRDWTATLFKAEMCQYIVDDLNVDYSASESVIVLINGEYWGVYNLRERINDTYIMNNYPDAGCDFDLIKYTRTYSHCYDTLNRCNTDLLGGIEVLNGSAESYFDLVNYLYNANPQSNTFFQEISQRIDIAAFVDYLIAEHYLANIDFIDNNVFLWKANETDALWRPIFYDLDGAMANISKDYLSELANEIALYATKPYWSTLIYNKLLNNSSFCERFSQRYNTLLNGTFSTAEITEHIDHFYTLYKPLMPLHLYRWDNPTDIVKWQANVDVLYDFAIQRPVEVFKQLSHPRFMPYHIYPQPIKDEIKLYFSQEMTRIKLCVYAMNGTQVMQYEQGNTSQLSLAHHLSDGLYILTININGYQYNEQIIVKH